MLMERSLLVEEDLYGEDPREPTALDWPPPMTLSELPAVNALPAAVARGDGRSELEMPELHLFARAARASRGPILVIGTAVTVVLAGGYTAGHAFGWNMPRKLRATVAPALTTLINEQIPALVARPGAPLWCPVEDGPAPAEARLDATPSSDPANGGTDAVAAGPAAPFELAAGDRPAISLLPRLRRPFQERDRPAPAWRGVVWSPRVQSLVSLSGPAPATLAAARPAGTAASAPTMPPFVQ